MNNLLSDFFNWLRPAQTPEDATPHLVASGLVSLQDTDYLPELIVQIAESQVGVREGKVNNTGPMIVEYQRATWLTPGEWPWCAAFVCWVLFTAEKTHGGFPWKRPRTAGAYDFEGWAQGKYDPKVAKSWSVLNPKNVAPRRGDIITFATHSHIGIVTSFDGTKVFTVEGNTGAVKTGTSDNASGDGVFAKRHGRNELRAIIRHTA